jgi:uncharacterized membrane protein (UPF0127 family)
MKKLIVSAVLAAAFAMPALAPTAFAQGATEPLTIVSGDKTHAMQVEVVNTMAGIQKGLSGRASLAKDEGLLMDSRTVREPITLTMKGVAFEVDALFLDLDGTVRAIITGARPGSLRALDPGVGAAAVLQIAGGQAAALGLKPGDKVKNKIFGNGG